MDRKQKCSKRKIKEVKEENINFLKNREECREMLAEFTYIKLYHFLIDEIGNDCTTVLSDLINKEKYFEKYNKLVDDKWFFNTKKNREKDTGISFSKQKKIMNELIKKNLIVVEMRGLPIKQFIKINHDEIIKMMLKKKGKVIENKD